MSKNTPPARAGVQGVLSIDPVAETKTPFRRCSNWTVMNITPTTHHGKAVWRQLRVCSPCSMRAERLLPPLEQRVRTSRRILHKEKSQGDRGWGARTGTDGHGRTRPTQPTQPTRPTHPIRPNKTKVLHGMLRPSHTGVTCLPAQDPNTRTLAGVLSAYAATRPLGLPRRAQQLAALPAASRLGASLCGLLRRLRRLRRHAVEEPTGANAFPPPPALGSREDVPVPGRSAHAGLTVVRMGAPPPFPEAPLLVTGGGGW